jgi:flavin-dependent dehydrogenase
MVVEIPTEQSSPKYAEDCIDIHFGIGGMGYGWVFPHGEYYSVGIGGLASSLQSPRKTMQGFLEDRGFDPSHRIRGHLIPVGGIRRTLASRRILLAGDAAGFLDSFTGEGIAYAIRSGQIAAEVIGGSLSSGGDSSELARRYEEVCRREFGANLRYSLLAARLMHRFPAVFFRLLAGNQEVIDNFAKVATAQWNYKRYLRWLILRLPALLLGGLKESGGSEDAKAMDVSHGQ